MENYLELINDYIKEKNDLTCFDSFSNDVRVFRRYVIKTFRSQERLKKCVKGIESMNNTPIPVPKVKFICMDKNMIVEDYIDGIALNEYAMHLSQKILYQIGQLMGEFHNVKVSDDGENVVESWIITILSDMIQIRQSLALYEKDFINSFSFVEKEAKKIFKNVSFSYVHGDFRPANIIYSYLEGRYYLIDFENFMIGDPTLDIYKMLSILKTTNNYKKEDIYSFLNGYSSVKEIPSELVEKWFFYDVYYSLRSVRRAINDKNFRNQHDSYIMNADRSAQRKNPETEVMANILKEYFDLSQE